MAQLLAKHAAAVWAGFPTVRRVRITCLLSDTSGHKFHLKQGYRETNRCGLEAARWRHCPDQPARLTPQDHAAL